MRLLTIALIGWTAAACGGIYDDVMPELRRIEPGAGTLPAARLEEGAVPPAARAAIPGAPAHVADQAYAIRLAPEGVRITAGGTAGERYARVTLAQLRLLAGGRDVPCATIVDWPRLKWRGVMNDCGRNFLAPEGVKAIVDMAARYKMNLFHWHLTEYHGWRLESKKYPALNARANYTRQIGRYYTQDEFREIIAYAKERGVTVMPEFDVPGHTYALRRGLGVTKMSDPKVGPAVHELLRELCTLASAEDMPFVHLGTDEARVDAEYVSETLCSAWAQTLADLGRKAVRWAPGEPMRVTGGEVIDMVWHDGHLTNSTYRAFDSARMYFASTDPFLLVNQTQFVEPCRWAVDPARKLGAIACAWHDDAVGDDTLELFRDTIMFPAIAGFADNYWHGRAENTCYGPGRRMPPPGDPACATVAAYERRMRAQRDRVLADWRHPFQFLSQADFRWRLEDTTTGKELTRDLGCGTVEMARYGLDAKHGGLAETWIHSPTRRTVGAWISMFPFGTAYVRCENAPLPEQGQWNTAGGSVEVNEVKIAPPVWETPGLKHDGVRDADERKAYKGAVYSNNICEVPQGNEEVTTRPPIPVELKEGWNHVVVRFPAGGKARRVFTFALLEGTSDRPREVEGLRYSSVRP